MARQRLCRHSCKSTHKEWKRIRRGRNWLLSSSDYRAELGTFHNERAAQRKRSELQSRFCKVLKEVDVRIARLREQAISSDVGPHGSSGRRFGLRLTQARSSDAAKL